MNKILRPAIVLFVALTVVTGVAYPLAVTGIAKAVFPAQAAGSLIEAGGKTVGSALIGQNFSDPKNFWGPLFELFQHTVDQNLTPPSFEHAWAVVDTVDEIIPALRANLRAEPDADPDAARVT